MLRHVKEAREALAGGEDLPRYDDLKGYPYCLSSRTRKSETEEKKEKKKNAIDGRKVCKRQRV
jgi:hypothetical protein